MDKFYDWLLILGVIAMIVGVLTVSWLVPSAGGATGALVAPANVHEAAHLLSGR